MEQVVVFNKLSVQNSNHTYKRSSRNACKQALHTLHRCNRKSCQMYFLNLHQVYSSQHSGPVRTTHRNYGKYSSNLKKTVPLEMTTKLACFLGWIENRPTLTRITPYHFSLLSKLMFDALCLESFVFYIHDDRGGLE